MLRATWWIEREGERRATLAVRPFGTLAADDRDEVADEARRMIDFAAADAAVRDVRFEAAVPYGVTDLSRARHGSVREAPLTSSRLEGA